MRITDHQGSLGATPPGSVVFDTKGELRDYVKTIVLGLIASVQPKLPSYLRWIVSVDQLTALVAAAFDRFWPIGTVPQSPAAANTTSRR